MDETPLDLDVIRAEWAGAGELEQREWALDHADALIAEVERLRDWRRGVETMSDIDLTEAAEAAARAMFEGEFPGEDWLSLYPETRDCWILTARGPVAAAAPLIEAQVRAQVVAERGVNIYNIYPTPEQTAEAVAR